MAPAVPALLGKLGSAVGALAAAPAAKGGTGLARALFSADSSISCSRSQNCSGQLGATSGGAAASFTSCSALAMSPQAGRNGPAQTCRLAIDCRSAACSGTDTAADRTTGADCWAGGGGMFGTAAAAASASAATSLQRPQWRTLHALPAHSAPAQAAPADAASGSPDDGIDDLLQGQPGELAHLLGSSDHSRAVACWRHESFRRRSPPRFGSGLSASHLTLLLADRILLHMRRRGPADRHDGASVS